MQCPGDRCCVNTGWPRARTGAAGGGRAGKGWRWLAGTNGHIMAPIKQSLQSREAATSPAQAAAASCLICQLAESINISQAASHLS